MTLQEMIAILCQEREDLRFKKLLVKEAQEQLERTPEWQMLCEVKQALLAVQDAVDQQEQMIRDEAIKLYRQTGDKRPHPLVSIRVTYEPQYDEVIMRNWLMSNAPVYLKIDVTRLKRSAKALPDAPLTWQEEPVACIASNLET